VPTKASLSLALLNWTGERKCGKRLVGQDKDREITHLLPSQENRLYSGKLI